jgi:Ser/Thr protein kinase RdoA (MazF antagonist)
VKESDETDSAAVRRTLTDRYKLRVRSLERFFHGQGTRNWVAETDSARYFVKEFHVAFDLRKKLGDLEALERLIHSRPDLTSFDETALELSSQRKAQIHHLPSIMATAARLDDQVLHSDYSILNILFDEAGLRAVIDFRPPHPFLIAYEVGRIAFYPESMAALGWRARGLALLRAYASEFPTRRENIVWCPHIWIAQLLRSNYGLNQHYFAPAELQDQLDNFFILRSSAATTLLSELDSLRAAIEDLSDELRLA